MINMSTVLVFSLLWIIEPKSGQWLLPKDH